MAQAAREMGGEGRVASLGSHFDIFTDRPLPELSTPYAAAYVAQDRELPGASVFALICSPQAPPRLEVLEALRGVRLDGILTPLASEVIDWPPVSRLSSRRSTGRAGRSATAISSMTSCRRWSRRFGNS